jgi:glutathione S-transferase
MRLYHHPYSSNARRAVMTALHLGTDVELRFVDLMSGEQRTPDFLRLNPNGQVPVLVDEELVLWESHAIMQYVADRTPGQTLYPPEIRARADVNRWLFWSAYHFTPAVSILSWERVVKPALGAGEADPAAVHRGESLVTQHARLLDRHLEGRTWVAQGQLTLADFALATPLMTMAPAKLPIRDFRHLLDWFERVQELDAWRRTGADNPQLNR